MVKLPGHPGQPGTEPDCGGGLLLSVLEVLPHCGGQLPFWVVQYGCDLLEGKPRRRSRLTR